MHWELDEIPILTTRKITDNGEGEGRGLNVGEVGLGDSEGEYASQI
jgi:hypothetical protein